MPSDPYDQDWEKYRERGLARAKELGARGPRRVDATGLAPASPPRGGRPGAARVPRDSLGRTPRGP